MSSHVVANALGHSSPAVTHAHYIQPSTQKRMSTKRVVDKLAEPSPTGSLHPVRPSPETKSARSVSGREKRRSPLLQRGESTRAIGGTRTPTVLPTGT